MGYSIEFFKEIHQRCVNPSSHVKNYSSASVVMYLDSFVFKMFVQLKTNAKMAVDGLVCATIYISS